MTLALNIAIGTAMISLSVIVHTFGLIAITWVMTHVVARFRMHGRRSRIVAMVSVVLGLFALMTVEVWGWAILYLALDAVPDLETALYLSAATFATVGYGDVVAHAEWRLVGAGRAERLPADRLVDRLSRGGRNAHRPLQAGRAFLEHCR